MKIHHYLHESQKGAIEVSRLSSTKIVCLMPGGLTEYALDVDERDQRALIVFDGELVYEGLSKNHRVVLSEPLSLKKCPTGQMRKVPDYQCLGAPEYIKINEKEMAIKIYRHFILLPSGAAFVRKYRHKGLVPFYVWIDVQMGKHGPVVEWRTTRF